MHGPGTFSDDDQPLHIQAHNQSTNGVVFCLRSVTELAHLTEEGAELIDPEPRRGLFGLEVAFVHPDSVHGVLTEVVSRG